MFVPGKPSQASLMVGSKAGAYLSEVCGLKALTTNIRLGRKGIPEAKTVAYDEPTQVKHLSGG